MSYSERDQAITSWGRETIPQLKREMRSLGIRRYTGAMESYLKNRYYRRENRITSIGVAMPRHAVFVHKGVGRGYPMGSSGKSKGQKALNLLSRGYNKATVARTVGRISNAEKMGKARKPKPWFNPVMDRRIPALASEVAKHDADIIATNILIQ